MSGELIAKPNKNIAVLRVLIASIMLFSLISILLIAFNNNFLSLLNAEQQSLLYNIGLPSAYVAIPICALLITRLVYILVMKKKLLVINSKGIIDNTTPASPGLIKWGEITDVLIISFLGQKLIGIMTKKKMKGIKGLMMSLNELTVKTKIKNKKVGVPVVIGFRPLDKSASEIITLSKNYLKK